MVTVREWLREFWHYRELFYFFVWRDVKVRYKQTALGAMWAVIQPFFTMVVFTLFFGKLARMPSDGIPYPIFSYCALVPWSYFSGAVTMSGNSLVSNSQLLKKVYFPRMAIPISAALSGLVDFGIASCLLFGMVVYYQLPFSGWLLLWPLLVVPLVFLAIGIGMILSSLNVKYRDVKYVIPFAIQIWLFLTPIIYPASLVPQKYRILVAMNPLSGIIEACRSVVLSNRPVDWSTLGISLAMTVVIFVTGLVYFRKAEKAFADLV